MRPSTAKFMVMATLAIGPILMADPVPAQEATPIRSGVAITALKVRPPLESSAATFTDVALHLIGSAGTETLGIAVRATVVPKTDLIGKEKAVVYFYATCDDEPPARSAGVPVATFDLGTLPVGRDPYTIVTTGTVTALVPLTNVACAKVAVVCTDCGQAASPHGIRRLPSALDSTVQDIVFDSLSLSLIGEPSSKSFGIAFQGTVRPTLELTGQEKAVVRLYTGCTDPRVPGTDATNVATVEIGNLRPGRDKFRLIVTKDATAFVAMHDIGCAVIDLE